MRTALACLLFAAIAGCAKPAPKFDYEWDSDANEDFAGLRTFAWIPEERVSVDDPRIDDAQLEKRVREGVDRQLVAKGYRPHRAAGAPDFWVAYHASLRRRLDVRAIDSLYPGRANTGGEYEAGTLVIDVVAPDGATLMWRGRVQTRIDPERDSDAVRAQRLDAALEGVMRPLPASH